jgi:hypothetical protein
MNAKKPRVMDNPLAPELFGMYAASWSFPQGTMISVALANQRMVDGEFVDVVVGRLVMPLSGFQDMAEGVNKFLASQSGEAPSDPA